MQSRVLAVMLLVACGGTYGGQPPVHPEPGAAQLQRGRGLGIEDAALPYSVLDAKTGRQLEPSAFWAKLASERVVCVGEEHKNPHHHWVELEVMRHLVEQWPHAALGMEMFQRPFQGVLDDFAAKRIDEMALRSRTGWEDRWGYDFGFYRPTIAVAVDHHAALLALDAAKELTKQVVHHGLASLTPQERAQLPAEIDLTDKKHRAWFDALMADMGGGGDPHNPHGAPAAGAGSGSGMSPEMPSEDAIYTVQVIWDETMADTAAKWLHANPEGRIVILAGSGHCHDLGIVNRLKRRGIADAVSLRTVIDDGQGGVADELAKPMTDFLVVLDLPAQVKKQLREASAKAE
ncbi:MAG: ChaN family lipoprotein [Kofleriaceae bacterium]